ncbi:MAG TPA: DUF3467 domain-containing protein [Candidatus Handelsmanbacteria bacterium]|jgi:hypothetical protein|nr:DUF3467 domain-containing protein [Candidatus Handelsmanbacteria bacterium]
MAEEQKNQEESKQVRVRWDSSNMTSTYANVANASSSREEVTLLFGTNKNWTTGQSDLTVDLSNRIILNPFAAKRLSLLLSNIVNQYESRFGELSVEAGPSAPGQTSE